jgi:cell division transport system permease protein
MGFDLFFFISEAITNIRRSGLMIVISVATITICMVVFGFFLLLSINLNQLADFISSKLEIRVYLSENLTIKEINDVKNKIANLESVKEVVFIDKQIAWSVFKKNFTNLELSDLVDINPLPHSFKVYLYDTSKIANTAKFLTQQYSKYIDDVGYMGTIAERIRLISKLAKTGGLVLVLFLTIATLLIVVNTIRLTVLSRHDEIDIMQLVGAESKFIKWPFIIEGLVMGVLGSVFAVLFLKFFYLFISVKFQESVPFLPLIFDGFLLNIIYGIVLAIGPIVGGLGAYLSVSRSLVNINNL